MTVGNDNKMDYMAFKTLISKRIVALFLCSLFLASLLAADSLKVDTVSGARADSSAAESSGLTGLMASSIVAPQTAQVADGFDFPVGTYGGFGLCPDNKGALECYWLCRGYQDSVNALCQKTGYGDHLGEDWNRGAISVPGDFGDTIYAVANGEVVFAASNVPITGSQFIWGKVIIIRHTLPDGTQVESQYAHVKDMLVGVGDVVTRGQPVATIGDGDGNWSSHLHFEIRYPNCPYWGSAGPAWSTNATGWANPANFISAHRTLDCSFGPGQGATGSELTAFQNAYTGAGGQAVFGCATGAVDTNGFTSFNSTLGHTQPFTTGQIQYLTNGNNADQAFAVLSPFDSKWNSLGAGANNPLGFAVANRSASLTTCYGARRMTQQFEGGSLEYHLTGALAESVFEVHGAIYQKWAQKGFSQCPLGMPTSDVMSAQASGATGNAGWVSDFQGGHIYWLDGAPDAYAVHGPIGSLYTLMGATGGWLGFPNSDEFLSEGNPRVNFEGGHITTTDGVNYQAFPAGEPPAGADLSVSVSDLPDPALLEENMTYGITVTNNGPLTATGVTLTDVLPSNVTFVSAATSQGTTTGTGTVTCNFGSLANGASATLTLVVKTKTVGTITNTVTVRAIEYDAGAAGVVPTGNNSHTEVTTVNPKTNLSITNVVSPDPSVIGQNVTYTLVTKNLGPSQATGVTVIDQLPSSLTFVSASSTAGSCNHAGGTLSCDVGSLAKNATATITIVATTNAGGPISNTATVSGNEADLITSNNTVTRTSNVRTLSGLSFTPSSVTGCKDSVGKVTLTGSAPAGGVTVSLSSADPAAIVPETVTVPAQSTNVTFTVSTTPVAASQPVTVTATLGPATKSGTLTLRPIGVQSLTLDPNPALGGSNVTGTVQLECAAGPGDVTVSVTSTNNSVAQVPASVIVPAGATSQTFNITTGNVSTASSSTIRAAASGTNSSAVLQVQPGAGTNQPPVVSAGTDQTIILPSTANLAATVTDDNLPNPPGTFTVAWTQVSGPGTVTFGNANAQATTASFTVAGVYVLRVTADDSALSAFDDVTVTVSNTATGSLLASIAAPPSAVDLTAEGAIDWAHWGLTSATSFNHKTGVPQQISNFTKIGSGSISRVNASPVLMSWTDGTPTLNASNTPGGIFIRGVNNGFQVSAPADTTDKVLNLYVGLWKAQGRLEVTLSDNSASPYIDATLDNNAGTSVRVYTISYRAGSAGQQLRIRWTMVTSYDSFGNITLQAATLFPTFAGPVNQAPTVNAGSDQTITLPAGATIDGTVTDDGLPNPPASFTTAWSKFSGPGTVTFGNASQVDTTATFSQSGTYVLRLTANDSALTTSDDVTVTVNPSTPVNQAPVVNAGSDQTITLPASASLSGTASDDGLPSPPGTVTTTWSKFSGPGTVTFGNASALNTTATFSQSGTYVLRLTANDSALSTSDDLTVIVNDNAGGSLTGSIATPPSAVDLTAEGAIDWAHWGLNTATTFNHKRAVPQQISNFTKIGTGGVTRFPNDPSGYSWTDGTPTLTATDTHAGVYRSGLNNGFQFTVPADTTERTLKVYVTVWGAQGKLEAILSDGSAAAFIDTSLAHTTGVNVSGVYTITYRAASAGQTLTIRWTVASLSNSFGNVTLSAATLAPGGSGNGRASTALSHGPARKLTLSASLERGHTEQFRAGRTLIRMESGPGLLLTGRQRWTGNSRPARRAGG